MAYGLQEPNATGVIPGDETLTAHKALQIVLDSANGNRDTAFKRWVAQILERGTTTALVRELNALIAPLEVRAAPKVDEKTHQLAWKLQINNSVQEVLNKKKYIESLEAAYAQSNKRFEKDIEDDALRREVLDDMNVTENLEISRLTEQVLAYENAVRAHILAYLVSDGVFQHLRQCARQKCSKFFIGGPRAKWHHSNCGGMERTTAKRKRDKEAGSLESRYL